MTTPADALWPEGRLAAVSLTFDDGHPSQLTRAVPLMEERGLTGTFYVCPRGEAYRRELQPWRELAARGHEIGNHSLSHICSRNFSADPAAKGLERTTLEEIEADIVEAERRLQEAVPAPARSFCYPCYQTDVGEGLTRQSYVPVVARHFVAARAVGEYGFFNHPLTCDLHFLWCTPGEHRRGPELTGFVERAARRGQWLIFAFHQIEGGRLGVAEYEFTELVDHLAASVDRVWTAPVTEVAVYARELRAR
jgi:hypothetical protein